MNRRAIVVAGTMLAMLAAPTLASAGTPAELLPDLVVRRASNVDVEETPSGRRRLRFTTTSGNLGVGVVELEPRKDDCDGDGDLDDDRTAVQHTYLDEDGDGIFDPAVDVKVIEQVVGCFVFHAQHGHWHFEDFARYRLVNPRTGRVVATQSKVGFCVVDNYRWRPSVPGSPPNAYYTTCDADERQGLSPGWADVYAASLPAQWLDVTGLPSGRYCLVQRIDPGKRIAEVDDTNNVDRTPIRLREVAAARLPGTC
jgi:hypothetical protein